MPNRKPDNVYYLQKSYEDINQSYYNDEQTKFDGGSSGDGGMWQQTVETRLAELRADAQAIRTDISDGFKEVRTKQEEDFRHLLYVGAGAALGLAGLMAKGFGWIG